MEMWTDKDLLVTGNSCEPLEGICSGTKSQPKDYGPIRNHNQKTTAPGEPPQGTEIKISTSATKNPIQPKDYGSRSRKTTAPNKTSMKVCSKRQTSVKLRRKGPGYSCPATNDSQSKRRPHDGALSPYGLQAAIAPEAEDWHIDQVPSTCSRLARLGADDQVAGRRGIFVLRNKGNSISMITIQAIIFMGIVTIPREKLQYVWLQVTREG
ncbi:hypothetical protein M752DRAFT_324471 [Aspergillus phoenicis ATCC 13157]|uniref:Uncharacterized protein n=1 Tax=Aspergillus phoenicis ATCC 13157 TaxID=1353007 RepID=A0A370PTQ7_ASPPH|nr:hypothetical protein M752DRAFT_324471 [Aspergillus phoenicis ATCC 13157]